MSYSPTKKFDQNKQYTTADRRMKWLAGIDEAGRGPLAGPVVAAAVVLDPANLIEGLDDSKKLSATKRALLESIIKKEATCWAVACATVEEIDQHNILVATMLAMSRALDKLAIVPDHALIDGNRIPDGLACAATAVVRGDSLHPEISAASILAKQTRDRLMRRLCREYPQYGFSRHKGYPTRAHVAALQKYGVCKHHRTSFAPVRNCL